MDVWSIDEKRLFGSVSELVSLQMDVAAGIQQKDIQLLSYDSKLRYWSFELGVIEFHDRLLNIREGENDCVFENFLIFHSKEKHLQPNAVLQFWNMEIKYQKFLNVRELGFQSVSNGFKADGQQRPGHCPWLYFKDAKIS
ncbi:hypothetical protein [Shewanella sp. MBTL60-007]|uniref:hypothetical protein n=1 Tax=Shewanella sp. MBTL60-007 TaxID=2815911 RepID=UPI001BBE778F|nr:hypothetical protein [Shewanella sp. MBTL60-007]GIU22188.1 hypothetical protein TUM3792_23990 [Shewanella sp. MBTL60-007]